jgi:hypothetical protein
LQSAAATARHVSFGFSGLATWRIALNSAEQVFPSIFRSPDDTLHKGSARAILVDVAAMKLQVRRTSFDQNCVGYIHIAKNVC